MESSERRQITIASVSDFLLTIDSKDTSSTLDGIHFVLKDTNITVLTKYVVANPSLSHIVNKLLPSIMQSSQHEYMAAIINLLYVSIMLLSKVDGAESATEVSKTVLNGHIKAFYRCLSSGNALCLASALQALSLLASFACDSLIHSFDFSHKGLMDASRMRRGVADAIISALSPRQAFIEFFVSLLSNSDYEARSFLSKSPFLFSYIAEGLFKDGFKEIKALLTATKDKIVFNEENNRNLAMAFLKNRQLNKIASLQEHKDDSIREETEAFLIHCFAQVDRGLCYSTSAGSISTLRNKLLFDIIMDFDPLNKDNHQRIILEAVKRCPDACWAYLCSGKLQLDPQPTVQYALSVNFTIKLLRSLPAVDSADTLVPKAVARAWLTRGISHSDVSVRLSTMMLLLAVLKRFSLGMPDELLAVAREAVPDLRTVYNVWKQNACLDEESTFLEHCFLETVYYYFVTLKLSDLMTDLVGATDIWKAESKPELAPVALNLLFVMDPVSLLRDSSAVTTINRLLAGDADECKVALLVKDWILQANLSENARIARYLSQRKDLHSRLIQAIYDFHHIPLIFSNGKDPILSYLGIDKTNIVDHDDVAHVDDPPALRPILTQDNVLVPSVTVERFFDLEYVRSKIVATNSVVLLNSACSFIKKRAVIASYGDISSSLIVYCRPSSFDDLLVKLLDAYDCATWMHLMASAFDQQNYFSLDIRLIVESGVLGYAIIGLSAADLLLRKVAHFVLSRFSELLAASRVKERRQISMILTALAAHAPPEDPLAPMSRLVTYLHALALLIMLRPDHQLYRVMNELFLTSPLITTQDAFGKLFFDSNDGWQRGVHWVLLWLEAAMGHDGQAIDECHLDTLHVAENLTTLMLSAGVEKSTKDVAEKILECLARKEGRAWLVTTLESMHRQ